MAHWSASYPVLAGYLLAAVAHLAGLRRLHAAGLSQAQRREAAVCQFGLLTIALALVSPVGYWSDVYIWVRAVQMLMVAIVGPGLVVLGAPWQAFGMLLRPGATAPAAAAGGSAAARTGHVPFLLAMPVAAVVVSNAAFLCWQVPALFDLARANSAVALAEHACYIGAGLLFWLQLITSGTLDGPAAPLRRIALLVGTAGVFTVAGMALVFGSGAVYPGYANAAHHVMTVLDDQQLSGAVLWMGSLPPFIIAGIALAMRWLSSEESAELPAGLDRLLTPRKNGWPSRPVIR
jgi:cytochrome c oxidase assembly factor CtaG